MEEEQLLLWEDRFKKYVGKLHHVVKRPRIRTISYFAEEKYDDSKDLETIKKRNIYIFN
jgi:hypothetical protein